MKTRALLLALLALAGCRDNRASITLTGICALTSACRFSAKCDAYHAGEPIIDAATSATGELVVFIEAENQTPDNSSKDLYRTNTNDAHVDEVVVEYGLQAGSGLSLPRQVMGTQQLVPAGGTSVIAVNLIPGSLGALPVLSLYGPTSVPRELMATVVLRGYFDDGSRFETGEYPIAVQVCSGCLPACTGGTACPPGVDGMAPRACN